jgi:cell shape-determining protein MreC
MMEEKKLATILEALADKIDNLRLGGYITKADNERLKEENERLKKENEDLRAENERYKKVSNIEFKKIERFGENDD